MSTAARVYEDVQDHFQRTSRRHTRQIIKSEWQVENPTMDGRTRS